VTSIDRGASTSTIGFDKADWMVSLFHAFTPTSGNERYGFTFTPASQTATATTTNTAYDWQGGRGRR